METVALVQDLRARVGGWRREGQRISFVPTMGNLHAGHHALVALARRSCDRVVTSVFVNPLQFGPREDYGRYPRTLQADAEGIAAECDLLFAPTVEEMYPRGVAGHAEVHVPGISDILCGASRPGHFTGVATVVAKLLNLVQPDVAVFGQKDYQQLMVIRRMVADLALPVAILPAPTVRDPDGLALSSRNQYLSPEQRAQAPELYRTLQWMSARTRAGEPRETIEAGARERRGGAGFEVDYVVVRRADDLAELAPGTTGPLVALAAAKLGNTRLIDNLLI